MAYHVKNLTKKPITLGDLDNVTIPSGQIVDLLSFPKVTKEKIKKSINLNTCYSLKKIAFISDEDLNASESSVGPMGPQGPQGEQGPPGNSSTPESSVFTRNINGAISLITYESGKTVTINRVGDNISTIVDSELGTYTINRDINGVVTGVSFA